MDTRGSFHHDPLMCKEAILMKDRIGYDELVDRMYTNMGLDRDVWGT